MSTPGASSVPLQKVTASAFTIPTNVPEEDGTLRWTSTTMVVVHAFAGGEVGIGYTYCDEAAAVLVGSQLGKVIVGQDALAIPQLWQAMQIAVRNVGREGIAASAIAAVETALWDLKGRLLGLPVVSLLGAARDSVPLYGSGGFTSYSIDELQQQLAGWVRQGIRRVKMKIGRDPQQDVLRVRAAREAIGDAELFVDANGAYSPKQALAQAEQFAAFGVRWFEEPVSSDDLEGLRLVRSRAPAGMDIAAGEYGYTTWYFRRMLEAGAVDVLQADASRCAGFTGFLQADALCQAHHTSLSAHTAPMLHLHVCCAAQSLRHLEYFHDHVRIERMFFDGFQEPVNGQLRPDLSRPGLGLELKEADTRRFAA